MHRMAFYCISPTSKVLKAHVVQWTPKKCMTQSLLLRAMVLSGKQPTQNTHRELCKGVSGQFLGLRTWAQLAALQCHRLCLVDNRPPGLGGPTTLGSDAGKGIPVWGTRRGLDVSR